MPSIARIGLTLATALALLEAPYAEAAAAPEPPAGVLVALDLVRIRSALESGDAVRIGTALETIRSAGVEGERTAPLLEALLQRGANAQLTEQALELLGEYGLPGSAPAILPYLRHRTVALRRAAVRALRKIAGEQVVAGLRGALRDRDAQVRSLASASLGRLRATEACDDLLVALARGVFAAGEPLGSFCRPQQINSIPVLLGKLPFRQLSLAFGAALVRADEDLELDTKVRLVRALAKMDGSDGLRFLRELRESWPKTASSHLLQELDRLLSTSSPAPGAG